MRTLGWAAAAAVIGGLWLAPWVRAQSVRTDELGVLELRFTPVRFAQLAIWVERESGEFLATVRLTEAVSLRGIGNRPGASEMNGGFRWPYGRREGVLPIWAKRRASAAGAQLFRRVIFQNRQGEGFTSRTSDDFSRDDYFCLSFDRMLSTREALDAVSCASPFTSDKGRYITDADVMAGYAEPYEQPLTGNAFMRPLGLGSLYPPRRDVVACDGGASEGCFQHPDTASFAAHALAVMPELDAVTMATPAGGMPQQILSTIPKQWEPGRYRACLEINVEGDYNANFNDVIYPSPIGPGKKGDSWDAPITGYGYPYRGQPSVVYCAEFAIGGGVETVTGAQRALGSAGTWDLTDPSFGELHAMNGLSDDALQAPGSGGDRLKADANGLRLEVHVRPALACRGDQLPGPATGLAVEPYPDRLHAHEWVRLRFSAAADDHGIARYEVRFASTPIVDDASFLSATPAKAATAEAAELRVPTEALAGQTVVVESGGLAAQNHYYFAVRAIDGCAGMGPITSAEYETPARVFATVTPCFVATAAYGTPLAHEIGVLRRLRDRYLASQGLGRAFLSAYYGIGPQLARTLASHDRARALVRALLAPVIAVSRALDSES